MTKEPTEDQADDEGMVTIRLPSTLALILRDILAEWMHDHARFSKAMSKIASILLSVLIDQIESQLPKDEAAPEEEKPKRRGRKAKTEDETK